MGGNMLPAAGTVLAMIGWRLDLLERALTGDAQGCPGLAEAARAAQGLRVTAELAERLLEEGYAGRCAEERAEREAAARARGGLRAIRAGGGAASRPA